MSVAIDKKLIEALNSLENAIRNARNSVANSPGANAEIINRLACYEDVVLKQKLLATNLLRHMEEENWDEVKRHGELIRQSSFLIEFDSEALLAQITGANGKPAPEFNA